MRRKVIKIIVAILCFVSLTFFSQNVFADVDESKVLEKWLLTQYIECASTKKMIVTPIREQQANNTNKNKLVKESVFSTDLALNLPSYSYQNVTSGSTINCEEMFLGSAKTANKGALSYSDKLDSSVKWSDGSSKVYDFLSGLGYKKTGNDIQTIQIKVMKKGTGGEMETLTPTISYQNGKYRVNNSSSLFNFFNLSIPNDNNRVLKVTVSGGLSGYGCYDTPGVGNPPKNIDIQLSDNFEISVNNIKQALGNLTWDYTCAGWGGSWQEYYSFPANENFVVESNGGYYTYDYADSSALNKAIKNLSGDGNIKDVKSVFWSNSERYTIYLYYLQKASGNQIACDIDGDATANLIQVKLKDGSGKFNSNCYVNLNGNDPKTIKVYAQNYSGTPAIVEYNLSNIIQWLKDVSTSGLADVAPLGTTSSWEEENGGDGNKATCISTGAGESLGWILCPVLSFLSNAAKDAYNNYVEPALMVEPALFQGSEKDSGVRYAWGIFQGIANTLFIILLIVVIFSQLTGVGIDNYGIKKILPKLIIAAVLINLSYLICIICVDLSNILGNSFQALFNNISEPLRNNIPSDLGISGISGWADSVGTTAITGLAVLFVLAVEIWSIASAGGWPAILLALSVSALSITVAIFFLFVLLAAREAAIIVLTVISPLAFACFILPNTKKFFDRWLKFGWGLLLVYPVCGLLVGGGNFVSVLMLSAGAASNSGFFSAFMAMIVGIVPIFFIPTVLKGSFSALGNLGAKISGMGKTLGNRWGGKVERGVQGTNRYKNYQAELGRRRQERSARSAVKRLNRKQGRLQSRGKELNARDMRMLARSQESLDKLSREDRAANTILMEQEFKESTQPELESAWNEAFDSGDTQRLDALTNVLIQKHGTSGANFIGRALAGKQIVDADGNVNQNAVSSLRTLQDNMNHNSTFAGHMKNKASDAYGMISNGGMVYNESTGKNEYRNMDHFSKKNAIATDIKDWSTQSGATLERAIASGALTTETIEQILNSTDPSIQSGIQSDKDKRDVLQAHMYDTQHPPTEYGPNLSTKAKAERYREEQRVALQNQQNAEVAQRDEMARNVADIAGALNGGASIDGAGGAGVARENEIVTIPRGQSSGSLSQDSGGLVDADDFIDYQMGRGEYRDERRRPSRINQDGQGNGNSQNGAA